MCYSSRNVRAMIYASVYFASMDWILIFLSMSILWLPYYSQKRRLYYRFFNVLVFFAIVDTIHLLLNFHFRNTVDFIPVHRLSGKVYCWLFILKPHFAFHMVFSYFLACTFIVLSIVRVAKIPVLFQKKYYALLGTFCLGVIINGCFSALHWAFNFSVLIYPIVLYVYLYFILNTIPNEFSGILMEQVALNISTAVICYDLEGRCLFANNIARLLFRSQSDEKKNVFLESYFLQWKNKLKKDELSVSIEDENFIINECLHVFSGEFAKLTDLKNRPIGYVIKLNDKTEYLNILEKEKYLASHDALTGLLNREAFLNLAEKEIKSNPDCQYVFVCSDIDDFKLINDIFGEEIGNEILIGEARTFEQIDYEGCIHGRISGDKFAMLMKKEFFDERDIVNRFDVFQSNLSKSFHYRVRIYLGVYEIENPEEDIFAMCDRGFVAIQKNEGDFAKPLNYYDMSMVQNLITEKTVLNDFSTALEHGEFVFYIQPQFNAKTQRVNGGEALVRWNQPVKGVLSPNNFVPILEKTDYIASLDYYIWEQVVRKLKDWKDSGFENYYISVNISAKDFYYLDVYDSLTKLVEKYGVNPKNLNLEVTETILMSNVEHHQKILTKLQQYGFKIEMDDFGSGYSSLSTLRNLVMDVLKIDMEFLRSTDNYEQSLLIINAIIDMAKALNMTVITEGVELENQADALTVMGCDIFQGYYFSRPIPVSEFEKRYLYADNTAEGGNN
ncbi:bifunctional diguanylate cyclase/phosphodiesterase [Treponema sp. C6A8]|uniref:putative bifunctional diguanylate cyclase/phosphodiesterase n=1 Tax=Treponema sp. C6A8 TaxID=1410609 RepID=UPI0018CC383B|nr:GGDEF domain-containing phosphodiesterase [Treponema sp. C6A8]